MRQLKDFKHHGSWVDPNWGYVNYGKLTTADVDNKLRGNPAVTSAITEMAQIYAITQLKFNETEKWWQLPDTYKGK